MPVEFRISKLLHGVPEDTERYVFVRAPDDGEYTFRWVIHAENLAEPTRSELRLRLSSTPEEGGAITTLDELRVRSEDNDSYD